MKRIICRAACFGILFSFAGSAAAQVKSIPFGDMEHWLVRQVDESGIIGGKTKFVYEVAKGDTLKNNVPFVQNLKTSPWGTSSILAVVKGITKSSTTVFPEYHQGHGLAARMETRIERVKVMGLINISVLATGTMFLGQINEPVRDTKNPMAKLIMGVEFREKPKSLIYDYYFQQGQNGGQRIKEPGFGRTGRHQLRRGLHDAAEEMGGCRGQCLCEACRHCMGEIFQVHQWLEECYGSACALWRYNRDGLLQALHGAAGRRRGNLALREQQGKGGSYCGSRLG